MADSDCDVTSGNGITVMVEEETVVVDADGDVSAAAGRRRPNGPSTMAAVSSRAKVRMPIRYFSKRRNNRGESRDQFQLQADKNITEC